MSDDDLFYSEDELKRSAYARVLVTGIRKSGKTATIASTAPGPVCLLNCDGPGAPIAALQVGAKDLKIADVVSVDTWRRAVDGACKLAEAGKVNTIVVDTFTLLVNNVLTLEYNQKLSGYDIWRNVLDDGLRGIHRLVKAPAHLFVVCHFTMDDGQLALNGALKEQIPAMLHDIVHFEFDPKKDPCRMFHMGPSASGITGGRFSHENKTIEADAKLLLAELGFGD